MQHFRGDEGSWSRATQDTKTWFHSWWFWLFESGAAILFPLVAHIYKLESFVRPWPKSLVLPIFGVVGMLIVVGLAYLINFAIAPYRQRNEARKELEIASEEVPSLDIVFEDYQWEEPDFFLDDANIHPCLRTAFHLKPEEPMQIARAELLISNATLPAMGLATHTLDIIETYTFRFEVPYELTQESRLVKVRVLAGGKWRLSKPFSLQPHFRISD